MRVVDTSAWIEWLIDSRAGEAVGAEAPTRENFVVPTIVQLELAKWMQRESPERADDVIAVTRECVVVPLSTDIALRAAELGREQNLPTADSIIYATAIAHGADLLTCDSHFKDLPGVIYVPKTPS